MNSLQRLGLSAVSICALSVAGQARAIPLPDTSSCSASNQCFKITNTGSGVAMTGVGGVLGTTVNGNGLAGTATGDGLGVFGAAESGSGVVGFSSGYHGVYGTSSGAGAGVFGHHQTGNAVIGECGSSTASAVYGNNTSAGGHGVAGRVTSSGTGNAIYGTSANSSTAWAGYFLGRVSATSYQTTSDARLKRDVQDLSYGMRELTKLRPVTYKWKDGANPRKQLGLIAQEVREVIPELVDTDKQSEMLSVNYPALVPVVIRALQEQQKLIKQQEARITQQDARIEALSRAKQPALAAMLAGGQPAVLAACLLPLGLLGVWRKRRARS